MAETKVTVSLENSVIDPIADMGLAAKWYMEMLEEMNERIVRLESVYEEPRVFQNPEVITITPTIHLVNDIGEGSVNTVETEGWHYVYEEVVEDVNVIISFAGVGFTIGALTPVPGAEVAGGIIGGVTGLIVAGIDELAGWWGGGEEQSNSGYAVPQMEMEEAYGFYQRAMYEYQLDPEGIAAYLDQASAYVENNNGGTHGIYGAALAGADVEYQNSLATLHEQYLHDMDDWNRRIVEAHSLGNREEEVRLRTGADDRWLEYLEESNEITQTYEDSKNAIFESMATQYSSELQDKMDGFIEIINILCEVPEREYLGLDEGDEWDRETNQARATKEYNEYLEAGKRFAREFEELMNKEGINPSYLITELGNRTGLSDFWDIIQQQVGLGGESAEVWGEVGGLFTQNLLDEIEVMAENPLIPEAFREALMSLGSPEDPLDFSVVADMMDGLVGIFSNEELEEAIRGAGGDELYDLFENAGLFCDEGLNEGILENADLIDFFTLRDILVDGLGTAFVMHSPSQLMAEQGAYISEGIALGIEEGTPYALWAVTGLAEDTMATLGAMNLYEAGFEVGAWLPAGMAAGIDARAELAEEAARRLARTALWASRMELLINSPSRAYEELGLLAGEGFALGLTQSHEQAEEAARYLTGVQDLDWVQGIDKLEMSDADLKLLWELAERETVNKYTTAEIRIDMGGVTNNVNSDVDVDGLMKVMGRKLMEQVQCGAKGLHL